MDNSKTTMFAMVSNQGTACEETALCLEHYTPEQIVRCEKATRPWGKDAGVKWEDCSGNDALACTVCGADASGVRRES